MSMYIAIIVGAILGGGFGKAIYFPRPRRCTTIVERTDAAPDQARQFFLSLV